MSNVQVCKGGTKLVFACSGAADVGAVSDCAARKMTADGTVQMFCLAGIGGAVQPILEKAKAAACLLAMDGCSLDCAKKTLEKAGFSEFVHLRVTDLGLEKGSTEINDANVAKVADAAVAKLA